ncbi:hypothetical protein KDN24_20085 [Bacillus sp. Bva_UNVM-123]
MQSNAPFRQASKVSFYGYYDNLDRDVEELDYFIEEILEIPSNYIIPYK